MSDIAERLEVSTVTVSKALSGQKGVSEEMREKIKELAEEMGYRMPAGAKSQAARKSLNIGVLEERVAEGTEGRSQPQLPESLPGLRCCQIRRRYLL